MHIFFDPTLSLNSQRFTLSEEESKHACRVLRLKEGDEIGMVNGKGAEFTAVITDANPKKCHVKIISSIEAKPEVDEIHIAIAPTKNIERIEWFIEKATEIGVTEISFLLCSNNERKHIKEERLEKILIAAMKQSKRLYLPKMNGLISFKEFIKKYPEGLIAHCYEGGKSSISEVFRKTACPVLIGPEGDFSKEEVQLALNSGYKTVTLGENRLRTETAGLYACMLAKMNLERTL